jgi:hypothetical protein
VTRSPEADIKRFHAEHQDIILKPLDGMGGMGIFRVGPDGMNLGSITETLNRHGAQSLMVQKFLPEIVDGDKRVLVIGGKPVPFCLARIPQGSEVRGNLAAGGKGVARPISARDREIAETLGPVLAARGLLLVGLDVIGDCLTEINVTSPTCFQEIFDQTGCDVAAHVHRRTGGGASGVSRVRCASFFRDDPLSCSRPSLPVSGPRRALQPGPCVRHLDDFSNETASFPASNGHCSLLMEEFLQADAPSTNTLSSPGVKGVQTSSVVSGAVTTTATRSLARVCSAKFTLTSSSLRRAVENGCWRTT